MTQPKPTTSTKSLHWSLEGVIALAAFLLSYFDVLRALDTGSLLQYGLAILMFVIGLMALTRAITKYRKGSGHRGEK